MDSQDQSLEQLKEELDLFLQVHGHESKLTSGGIIHLHVLTRKTEAALKEMKDLDQDQDQHCPRCGGLLGTVAKRAAKELGKAALAETLKYLNTELERIAMLHPETKDQIAGIRTRIEKVKQNPNPETLVQIGLEIKQLSEAKDKAKTKTKGWSWPGR